MLFIFFVNGVISCCNRVDGEFIVGGFISTEIWHVSSISPL